MLGPDLRTEVLVARMILHVEDDAPDEICGETAEEHDYQSWESRQKGVSSRGLGCLVDGSPRGQSKREAGAHDSRKGCYQETLCKTKLRNGFFLLGLRHFLFFG